MSRDFQRSKSDTMHRWEDGLWNESTPFMAFTSAGAYSKYGTWGHREWTTQPDSQAPKARALHKVSFEAMIFSHFSTHII